MSAWDSIQNQIKNRQTMGNHAQHPSTKSAASPMRNMTQRQSGSTQRPPINHRPVAANRTGTPSGRPPQGKKPRVRYDRILLVLLILIGLICLMVMGIKQCGKDDSASENKTGETVTTTTQISTEPPEKTLALTAEDVHKGSLILVNADHAYTFAADDVTLETVYEGRNTCYGVSDMEVSLDADVIDHFNQLMQAYYNIYENNDIMIVSGYRTREVQAEFYESKKTMLPGGYSDYHTARSFDLVIYPDGTSSNYYAATGDYAWIAEHAAEYGFVLRYPDGKADKTGISPRAYTFRYVGIPHASYIYENGLCLEEYLDNIQSYTARSPLEVKTTSGEWSVFYNAANSEGSTQIAVPQDAVYTVSGDNMGGFIVAYQERSAAVTTTAVSGMDSTETTLSEEMTTEIQ
ncbi:MAG: M15 family metallopeptidase [Oscillospiraceae bacterium]|nr:M15 family metallopeptidase [Oscillospiraceae bacterium]MDY2509702.1 M15 family metallopeptidase [Ruminococcus callidus]